jgi:hypothetical protein
LAKVGFAFVGVGGDGVGSASAPPAPMAKGAAELRPPYWSPSWFDDSFELPLAQFVGAKWGAIISR